MESKKLPDTAWHIGYTKKHDEDPRRHKSRCIYKQEFICHNGKSGAYLLRCPGSSHCIFYAENKKMAEKVYRKTRSIEEERRDKAKKSLFAGKAKIQSDKLENKSISKPSLHKENDAIYINMADITISADYYKWTPTLKDKRAVSKAVEYYKRFYTLGNPITVLQKSEAYYLTDGIIQYYAAKQLFLTRIKAIVKKDKKSKERK